MQAPPLRVLSPPPSSGPTGKFCLRKKKSAQKKFRFFFSLFLAAKPESLRATEGNSHGLQRHYNPDYTRQINTFSVSLMCV